MFCSATLAASPEGFDTINQRNPSERLFPSTAASSGCSTGKICWVSYLPKDLTDEQISKAVAAQLRGQRSEGHVTSIERVPFRAYGFLELDTESCATELVANGLYLRGRRIIVDFPRGNSGRSSFVKQSRQQLTHQDSNSNNQNQQPYPTTNTMASSSSSSSSQNNNECLRSDSRNNRQSKSRRLWFPPHINHDRRISGGRRPKKK